MSDDCLSASASSRREYQAKRARNAQPFDLVGSPTRARTWDLRINSPSLYRLSYRGFAAEAGLYLLLSSGQARRGIFRTAPALEHVLTIGTHVLTSGAAAAR